MALIYGLLILVTLSIHGVRLQRDGSSLEGRPTIVDSSQFNAQQDAVKLHSAMKGLGTNEKAVIGILAMRSPRQRQEIAEKYQQLYGKSLAAAIKGDFSGTTEDALVGLLKSPAEYRAQLIKSAIKGPGTDLSEIAETICGLSPEQLEAVKQAYQTKYKKSIDAAVAGDTSGPVKTLLIDYLKGSHNEKLTPEQIRNIAKMLQDKGFQNIEGKGGIAELLANTDRQSLRRVLAQYKQNTNKDAADVIKDPKTLRVSQAGKLKKVLLHLVKCINDPPAYYAQRLYETMKGPGTSDKKLMRILISRSDIDLQDIKDAYQKKYNKPLQKAVQGDTSRNFQKVLTAIINGNAKGDSSRNFQKTLDAIILGNVKPHQQIR